MFQLFSCEIASQDGSLGTLQSVQILFRHGTREPDEKGFGSPTGHLKSVGKKEMYDLGILFRQRYDGFISPDFDENEISIVSSDVDRAIQSTLLVAFGLYKDFNLAASWNEEELVLFEPIPIRTIPKKYDKFIQMLSHCPRSAELYSQHLDSYYIAFSEENKDMIAYYANQSGDQSVYDRTLANNKRFSKMVVVQEELIMNASSHLPMVEWAKPLMFNEAFLSIKTNSNRKLLNTVEKKRLFPGSLLKLLIENMEQLPSSRKKMYLFGGHDRIIIMIMLALGVYDPLVPTMPPTAASFILELHHDAKPKPFPSKQFVKMLYRNDSSADPHLLQMPNCGTPCYLSTFVELTKDFLPTNFEAECLRRSTGVNATKANVKPNIDQSSTVLSFSVLIISLLIISVVAQILFQRRRNYTNF